MQEIKKIGEIASPQIDTTKQKQKTGASFEETMREAIKQVAEVHNTAEQAIEDFSKGKVQDIHQVVVAVQKADLSMQTLMAVRTKLLTAYEEIMRTPV